MSEPETPTQAPLKKQSTFSGQPGALKKQGTFSGQPGTLKKQGTQSLGPSGRAPLKKQMTFSGGSALSPEATAAARAAAAARQNMENIPMPDEIRAEVEAAGIEVPSGDELKRLSSMFNERVDRIVPAGEATTWFKIFKDFDVDHSGLITFDEIESGVRERLRIKESELSQIHLKALWLAMDSDDNGYIESAEFHTFMGRKETQQGLLEKRQAMVRQKTMKQRELLEEHKKKEIEAEGFKSSVSTQEMRADLESRGVPLADEEEKVKMAVLFMEWVADYMPDRHGAIAWLLVFKEVDDDASGLLTFDELRMVIRRKCAAAAACAPRCYLAAPVAHPVAWTQTGCARACACVCARC